METDMDYAIQELERLQFLLECYRDPSEDSVRKGSDSVPTDLLHPLTLQATIDPTLPPVSFQTTFGRELWFCSLHAVRDLTEMISLLRKTNGLMTLVFLCFSPGAPLCDD